MNLWIVISGMPGQPSIGLGKSTLAQHLAADIAAQTPAHVASVPFAGALKELVQDAATLDTASRCGFFYATFREWGYHHTEAHRAAHAAVAAMRDYPLVPGEKPRKLLQVMGTDVCRKYLHPDVWAIRAHEAALRSGASVIISDDCRFDNEATFGVWLQRVGVGFPMLHVGIDPRLNPEGHAANLATLPEAVRDGNHSSETSLTRIPDVSIAPRWTDTQYATLLATALTRLEEQTRRRAA